MPTSSLSPAERRLRAQLGAHSLHASHDSTETTAKARAAFLATFEDTVDPDKLLSIEERQRRARHALRAHMTRLALRGAEARRQERLAREEGELDALLD